MLRSPRWNSPRRRPLADVQRAQHLSDYIKFAQTCQANPATDDTRWDNFARACFTLEGNPRPWSNQSDGPALQSLALLQAYRWVDDETRDTARDLIVANVDFLLSELPAGGQNPPSYRRPTTSPWEEESGSSFFARAVQLRCIQELKANTAGIPVPPGVEDAITWLTGALSRHWSAELGCYLSFEPPWKPDPDHNHDPYDPNSDIVLAALYGTIPAEDERHPFLEGKLLASASAIRATWTDAESTKYPINTAGANPGFGPLLGRYPSDYYDGDTNDPQTPGHPWSLCTSAFAELYYRVADDVAETSTVPSDSLATEFLKQAQTSSTDTADSVAHALCKAGDAMLRGLIFHSDDLQLGEQFDRETGFERSLANLTWSYASFLSAVRARPGWAPA